MHSKLKYYLIFFIVIITSMSLSAQEGIGTDAPDKSAALEIRSTKRGLLIPRVELIALDNQSPISETPAESLLVYNTIDNAEISPGFYYWEDGSWKRLLVDGDVNGDVEAFDLTSDNGTIIITDGDGATLKNVRVDINPSSVDGQFLKTENGEVIWAEMEGEGVESADLELEENVLVFLDDTDGSNRLLNEMAKIGIADHGITPVKIAPGENGQVLQTINGEVVWEDLEELNLPSGELSSLTNILNILNGENATLQDAQIEMTTGDDGQVLKTENGEIVWGYLEDVIIGTGNLTSSNTQIIEIENGDDAVFHHTEIKLNPGSEGQVLMTVLEDSEEVVMWSNLDLDVEPIEPWEVQNSDPVEKATENNQNIYQEGNVAIGKTEDFLAVSLDVSGSIRGGQAKDTVFGANSFAHGVDVVAQAQNSAAFGRESRALGDNSFTAGRNNNAKGVGSTTFGYNSRALGSYSFAAGHYLRAGYNVAVFGRYNAFRNNSGSTVTQWQENDPLFEVGNGTGAGNNQRQNALTILKNGKMGIGMLGTLNTEKPQEMLDVGTGNVRIRHLPSLDGNTTDNKLVTVDVDGILKSIDFDALVIEGGTEIEGPWKNQVDNAVATENTQKIYQNANVAINKENSFLDVALDVKGSIRAGDIADAGTIGSNSFAMGTNSTHASGNQSFAFGQNAQASGVRSFAFGENAKALQQGSFAFGPNTQAGKTSGNFRFNFAFGNMSKATGDYSFAAGLEVEANNKHEFVFGRYNAIQNQSDTRFQLADGTVTTPKNLLTILSDGNVGIGIAGTEATAKPTEMLDIGSGKVKVRELPATIGVSTDKLVVVNEDGILRSIDNNSSGGLEIEDEFVNVNSNTEVVVYENGSLKKASSMMPKYFHMPAVALPLDDGSSLINTTGISHSNGTFTIDLHAIYSQQFGMTGNSISSAGLTHSLPTLDADELIYNITYYDNAVFTQVNINANGILTYKILNNADDASIRTYMNIVFEIKD